MMRVACRSFSAPVACPINFAASESRCTIMIFTGSLQQPANSSMESHSLFFRAPTKNSGA